MPAIQGVWVGPNPVTQEDGVWLWLSHAKGLVGIARTAFPAFSGTETPASYSQKLTDLAQNLCTDTTRLAANDPRLTNPEPGCSVSGRDYTCQIVRVTVTVTQLTPTLIFSVEVANPGS